MTSRWSNPTGGWLYHCTALFRRRRLWAPFTAQMAQWLAAWDLTETSLLLIGPSGGYSLSEAFLSRFQRIVAVDIDPLARWIFRWRFRRVLRARRISLLWDSTDYLSPDANGFSTAGISRLLEQHGDAAVLFCNILGQLPLLGDDRDETQDDDAPSPGSYEHWLHQLQTRLAGRSWASYHDRLSGSLRPQLSAPSPVAWQSSEELVSEHYRLPATGPVELVDHRTSVLAPQFRRWKFEWQLAPRVFHLIEAIRVERTSK